MLDDFLAALLGNTVLDSLRGRLVARIFVLLAVASVLAVLVILLG